MRKKLPLLLMFCLGVGLANAVAQKAKDATEVDPDGHRVHPEHLMRIRRRETRYQGSARDKDVG